MATKNSSLIPCSHCESLFTPTKYQASACRLRKNTYCSAKCRKVVHSKLSSIRMAETNRKYASDRMKKNNPMKNEKSRLKMKETLNRMGHKPKKQGGNGKGLTEPQKLLLETLGCEWVAEYPIPTKIKRGNGYPTCYKVDIALPSDFIAIEVDGFSHSARKRQEQDKKKTNLLNSLGWAVIRVSNSRVMEDVQSVAQDILKKLGKECSYDNNQL